MERLTHKSRSEAGYKANRGVPLWECLDKLGNLEDLQEQGRLLELPCAVGDTVYTNASMRGWYFMDKSRPYEAKVVFVGVNGTDNYMNVDFENGHMLQFRFSDIGRTVFLTLKEAEEALKRKTADCFIPEKDNPYPLCVGKDEIKCRECQLRSDWEPKGVQGAVSPVCKRREYKVTEQEAIMKLKTDMSRINCVAERYDAMKLAVSALEELQQYREIGTVDRFWQLSQQFAPHMTGPDSCPARRCNKCDKYRRENEKYHEVGTVEECREAREKQRAKKIAVTKKKNGVIMPGDYVYYKCPNCGYEIGSAFYYPPNEYIRDNKFCRKCGQCIDWDGE